MKTLEKPMGMLSRGMRILSVWSHGRRRNEMRSLLRMPAIAIALWLLGTNVADASYCGALRSRCRKAACFTCQPTCCKVECHPVMKKVKEIVYDEEEVTCYRTVYEEVPGEQYDAVKYEEATAYRYKCCDACEQNPSDGCGCSCAEAPRKCSGPTTACAAWRITSRG